MKTRMMDAKLLEAAEDFHDSSYEFYVDASTTLHRVLAWQRLVLSKHPELREVRRTVRRLEQLESVLEYWKSKELDSSFQYALMEEEMLEGKLSPV